MKPGIGLVAILCMVASGIAAEEKKEISHKERQVIIEQLKREGGLEPVNALPPMLSFPKRVEAATSDPSLLLPEHIEIPVSDPRQALRIHAATESARRGEENAGAAIESVLQQLGEREPKAQRQLYASLARWHASYNRYAEAAQAQEKQLDFLSDPDSRANISLEAARFYLKAENREKADQLYSQIPRYGYGWATGMALYDEATLLMQTGHPEQAQLLIENALQSKSVRGRYSEQIEPTLLTTLAFSQYRQGNLRAARRSAQAAQRKYRALQFPLLGEGLQEQYQLALALPQWVARWSRNPFYVSASPLKVRAELLENGSAVAYFNLNVESRTPIPLEFAAHDSRIHSSTAASPPITTVFSTVQSHAFQLLLPAQELPLRTAITVTSPEYPHYRLRVPIQILLEYSNASLEDLQ